jgi:hypothetical protein
MSTYRQSSLEKTNDATLDDLKIFLENISRFSTSEKFAEELEIRNNPLWNPDKIHLIHTDDYFFEFKWGKPWEHAIWFSLFTIRIKENFRTTLIAKVPDQLAVCEESAGGASIVILVEDNSIGRTAAAHEHVTKFKFKSQDDQQNPPVVGKIWTLGQKERLTLVSKSRTDEKGEPTQLLVCRYHGAETRTVDINLGIEIQITFEVSN